MRLLVTGGGTGGHVYPGLSVIREMSRRDPNLSVLYVGTERGMEADIVPKEGIEFKTVSSQGFKRKLSLDTLKTVGVAAKGVWQARRVIRDFRPDVVLGTGGYVAGPVVLQAAIMGIPCLIHEQNALPSVTNRILARFVQQIALSFPEAKKFLPPRAKTVVTGNPIRPEILQAQRGDGIKEFGLDAKRRTLLVVGGSRGAEPINQAVLGILPEISRDSRFQVLFVTGSTHYDEVMEQFGKMGLSGEGNGNIIIKPYLYNIPMALAAADLIIARAGSMIAEITAVGLPAIFIPSPYVADNHQEHNAQAIAQSGAGVIIREGELRGRRLLNEVLGLLGDASRLQAMHQSALALGKPQAAGLICLTLESLVRHKK